MRKYDYWTTMGAVAACAVLSHHAFGGNPERSKPNLVFILIDDLGWMDVGCNGSKYYETPNIDRLARQGMRFTDGYAACAVCSPSRAALLTGRYPSRLHLTNWIHFLDLYEKPDLKMTEYESWPNRKLSCPRNPYWMDLKENTIAETLKTAGYATGYVGKWHLGPEPYYPDHQGFDVNIGGCDYGQPPSYFDPYIRKGDKNRAGIPTLKPRKEGEYLCDRLADEAVTFINRHKDQPFLLYYADYAVHAPIESKPELVAKYRGKPMNGQKNAAYAAMIESVDHGIGRLLDTLDSSKLADNTIVVFTSDNGGYGEVTDNAPLRESKGFPYEGGIRVPLIVRWPGVVEPGSLCHEQVTSVDFFPTLCQAVEVKPPDGVIDGESIMPLLRQAGTLKRDAIYWHFPHYRPGNISPYSIIRSGDWKLIKFYEDGHVELYNLAHDLSEKTNLAKTMPELAAQLEAKLMEHLKEVGAQLPRAKS